MIELRHYQTAAVDALFAYFGEHTGNPLCVLPTGSGKSLCIAEFCRRACEAYPETRILIATHRAELIQQDADAIRRLWPTADVGVYSAGLGRRQLRSITVGGVQSLAHVEDLPRFDLLLIDECHLVPKEGEGQYRTLIARLTEKNEALKIVGFTATPFRLSGGRLTRGKNKLFSSIAYELPVQQLVDEGYLAPLVVPQGTSGASFSTSGVATRGGDWAPGELASSVEAQDGVTRRAVEEAALLAADRKSWLVFCVSVEHARQALGYMFGCGIGGCIITGETDAQARRNAIDSFKRGDIRALVSVDVLTTGFDAPNADCIVLLRPTQSTGLYVQICGRGMRLSPATGKRDCLVLDYGSNIERHGPITAVKPKESKDALASVNEKACPRCDFEQATWRRECPECGYIFPIVPRLIEHDDKAARLSAMGPPPPPEWIDVVGVEFDEWRKKTAPDQPPPIPTMRVRYLTGNMAKKDYLEWQCPQHSGFAREKFCRWWQKMGGLQPPPRTVADTLERARSELRVVTAVTVEPDGKYTRIKDYRLAPVREPGADDEAPADSYAEPPMYADDGELPF